nr:ribose 5-phosphate isomerase B [Tepidanaerobacter syntrophicus]
MTMKIAVGSDHIGLKLKKEIIEFIEGIGYACEDFGTYSSERTDYPIYSAKVAKAVARNEYDRGILICGTGVGVSIVANKIKGIRAVVCSEPYSAELSRKHNNTNVLSFGANVVGPELAKMIVKIWLETGYDGGRHQKRIDMIAKIEKGENVDKDMSIDDVR